MLPLRSEEILFACNGLLDKEIRLLGSTPEMLIDSADDSTQG